ncbi:class A beta-lactamase-related serine hydrolase, partial [Oscillatoria sp. CS-180]|uniref:serine hydrolase n=1 Tax=Oscillatoria sp. CS-180 TaxID=3021720 RepID=UPI00232C75E0
MADNNQQLNNNSSPLRRYVPPADGRSDHTNVTPLPKPLPLDSSPAKQPGVTPRRSRTTQNVRSRWRKWIQTTSPKATEDNRKRSPVSSRQPQQASFTSASSHRPVQLPGKIQPHSQPRESSRSAIKDPLESFAKRPQVSPVQPAPVQQPQTQPPNTVRVRVNANKVTPLKRQPVWSTPADSSPPKVSSRRESKPRRSTRKAPRPVLYGIRLLILGTGIAAIAGTILSSLNPQKEGSTAQTANPNAPQAASRQSSGRNALTRTTSLPLAEELISVETDLVALESMTPGLQQSVFFYDLDTNNYIDLNGTEAVSAASTIKLPILIAFLEAVDNGTVRLDQAVTLQEDMIASGSGDMQLHEIGSQYTALEVATEMIVNSDNTATNLMITLLGGTNALNTKFQEWGLDATLLRNLLPDLDGTNTTSAADLVRMMTLVDRGELLSMRSR